MVQLHLRFRYRNSYKHNLCIQMLKEGFHKSFEELFSLIEQRKQERLEAGIDSVLWQVRAMLPITLLYVPYSNKYKNVSSNLMLK